MSLYLADPKNPVYLIGPTRALGERVIDNEELVTWMGAKIRSSWIERKTGIKTRRWVREDQATSDLAKLALSDLAKKTSFAAVRTLVLATVSGDYSSPPTAPFLQHEFQLSDCMCFDLGAACAGFISGLQVCAAQTLATHENSLLVAADIRSKYLNPEDFSTAVLFGDGASAGLITLKKEKANFKILGTIATSDGSYGDLVTVPAGGTKNHPRFQPPASDYFIQMKDGAQVFLQAVHAMTELPLRLLSALKLSPEEINWVVPHQANLHLLKEIQKRIPAWAGKVSETVIDYGNTSGSSVGIALSHVLEKSECKVGDRIVLTSAGGGGLVAAAVLERV